MPFGLKATPATFQRAMEIALAGLTFEICLCYLDDVIVFGRDLEEHNSRLRMVLKRVREFNLEVKLSKFVFAAKQVCYLGHVISQQGNAPDPAKIDAVKNILPPSDLKQLQFSWPNWLLPPVCDSIRDSGAAVNTTHNKGILK